MVAPWGQSKLRVLFTIICDGDNGQPIEDCTRVVGQQIDLKVKLINLDGVEILGPFKSVDWIIEGAFDGSAIKNYTTNETVAKVTQLSAADLQSNPRIKFYWVQGGDKMVMVFVKYQDQPESCWPGQIVLNVQEPKIAITREITGKVRLADINGYYGLHSGERKKGRVGMKITAEVTGPTDFNGQFRFTQTVNTLRQYKLVGGAWTPVLNTAGQYWLDNVVSYSDETYAVDKGKKVTASTTDTPGGEIPRDGTIEAKSVTDKFRMYVMYKPTVATAIWVPIGVMVWGWHGTARSTNGGYRFRPVNLGQDATIIKTAPGQYPQLPEWPNVAKNTGSQ